LALFGAWSLEALIAVVGFVWSFPPSSGLDADLALFGKTVSSLEIGFVRSSGSSE
jgi:hypothetical protein